MLREAPKKSIARYAMEYGVYFGIFDCEICIDYI